MAVLFPEDKYCIVGLDASVAKTGLAINTIHGFQLTTVPTDHIKDTGFYRYIYAKEQIFELVMRAFNRSGAEKCFVFKEDYAFGMGNSSSITALAELGGLLKEAFFFEKNVEFIPLTHSVMVKFITDNGRKQKPDVMRGIDQQFGIRTYDYDESDAAGLFLYGHYLLHPEQREEKLRKAQIDYLALKEKEAVEGKKPKKRKKK